MTELQMVTEAMGYKSTGDCYVHVEAKNGSGHYVVTGDGNALIKTALRQKREEVLVNG